jgi:hypothetical protein
VDAIARWLSGPQADRRRSWVLFGVLFLSFAYFAQGAGPNQSSRFDLTRAIVEQRSLAIDKYAKNTIDKAEVGGHFYSDKAPGLSFAAVPAYAVIYAARGFQPPRRSSNRIALYILSFVVVGGASAAAGAALYRMLRRFDVSWGAAVVAIAAWWLGTNAFAYATIFMAHAFVAALLALSFAALHAARETRSRTLVAAAGALAGWATISEYPAAVVAALLFAYGVKRVGLRHMAPYAAASAIPLVLLGAYNASCFGSPFSLGYQHLAEPEFQRVINRGFFGIALPSPSALVELLFGEFRGILPLAPWMLAAIVGAVIFARKKALRAEAALSLATAAFFIVLASSYARWDGGNAMGPRYVVPAFAFVAIAFAFALDEIATLPRLARAIAGALAASSVVYSIALCTMCVAVMPEFPEVVPGLPAAPAHGFDRLHPLTTFVVPFFFRGLVGVKGTDSDGNIDIAIGYANHQWDAFNLGELVGLEGSASVVPLVVLWIVAALVLATPALRAGAVSR